MRSAPLCCRHTLPKHQAGLKPSFQVKLWASATAGLISHTAACPLTVITYTTDILMKMKMKRKTK